MAKSCEAKFSSPSSASGYSKAVLLTVILSEPVPMRVCGLAVPSGSQLLLASTKRVSDVLPVVNGPLPAIAVVDPDVQRWRQALSGHRRQAVLVANLGQIMPWFHEDPDRGWIFIETRTVEVRLRFGQALEGRCADRRAAYRVRHNSHPYRALNPDDTPAYAPKVCLTGGSGAAVSTARIGFDRQSQ
jgi:hypothetical protein